MNTAVSIWFSKMTDFDPTGCPSEIPPSMTLRDVDVLWRYPGHGDFTHGNHDIYLIKKLLLSWADEDGNIDLNTLTKKFFVCDKESSKQKLFQDATKQRAQKVRASCHYTTISNHFNATPVTSSSATSLSSLRLVTSSVKIIISNTISSIIFSNIVLSNIIINNIIIIIISSIIILTSLIASSSSVASSSS